MAANLVPHYLGLALPMAFTAAIFIAAARLSDDNELDVMLTTGRSITRLATPYFVLGLLLSLFSVYLLGYLQPLARYGYHWPSTARCRRAGTRGSRRTASSRSDRADLQRRRGR